MLGNGESQSGSPFDCVAFVDTFEFLEYLFEVVFSDAAPRIPDGDRNMSGRVFFPGCRNCHLTAGLGEVDGVSEEILKDPLDVLPVNPYAGQLLKGQQRQGQFPAVGQGGKLQDAGADDPGEIFRLESIFHHAGFHSREIEHLVHKCDEPLAFIPDNGQQFMFLSRHA